MSLLQAVSPHDVVARVKAKSRALRKSHSTVAQVSIQRVTTLTTDDVSPNPLPVAAVACDEQCANDSTTTTLQASTTNSDGVSSVNTACSSSDTIATTAAAAVPQQQEQGQQLQTSNQLQSNQLQQLRRESLRQLEKPLWLGLALLTQTKEQHQAGMYDNSMHTPMYYIVITSI
jgi:hypothetical protein